MKKNLFMVAAVALAMVSCNKEEINTPVLPQEGEASDVVFVAEFDQEAQTKTALGEVVDGKRQATWVAGDAISINGTTFTAKADGATAEFTTTVEFAEADVYRAVYPANSYKSGAVMIPASQDGTFANASIAVAESNNQSLKFSNVSSILKFQVSAACETVTFESTNSIAGNVSVAYENGVMTPNYGSLTQLSKKVTVTAEGGFVAGKDYYVAVKPGAQQFTVSIDGNLSKASSKTVTVERSKIMSMGVLPEAKLNRNLQFSESNVSGTRGTDLSEPELSGVAEGVVYTSSDTEVATVDPVTGNVTMLTKGTTVISAYVAESNTHAEATASYTLEVLPVYYGVYVCISDLGWTSVNMHIFDADGYNTEWPGGALNEEVTINGKTYYKKTIEEGTELNITYNNGKNNSNYKIDLGETITVNEDIYYRLSARGAIKVDPNDKTTFGYAIYVFDQKSKNQAPNLYTWNDLGKWKEEYNKDFNSWPGGAFVEHCYYKPADDQNHRHYYYYLIPTALYDVQFNYIVNKKGQTSDLTAPKSLTSDLYVGYWYNDVNNNGFWVNNPQGTPIINLN